MTDLTKRKDLKTPDIKLGTYKHYKGKFYEVIGVALHSETLQPLVIYKPLYRTNTKYWVRPLTMFFDKVEINDMKTPRFKIVE